MAFASGSVATISVDGTDISGSVEDVKFDRKAKEERHHVLNSQPVVTLVHTPEFTITIKGLIDSATADVFTANLGPPAPSVAVEYQPQGSGGPVRTCVAFVTDYTENTAGDKTGTFDATLAVDGAVTDA